jgi:eukaryotic-like serine/threonine-protein kinase
METGQVIGSKYRLNRVIGTGGMASVWSATNVFTERQHAIKFLLPSVAGTQEAVDRFLQEAKISARINHPNVIEIVDVGKTEDESLFLVMELLSGVGLDTALKRQNPPMTASALAFIMADVARALAAAHRAGVVHRDLKPTNIYLHKERDGKPQPKVLDFGVSKFVDEERSRLHALTMQGTVLGSPLYMSPEQARGEAGIDGRSDMFSFGAILFEALTGERPYDGANFNALLVKIATQAPKNIHAIAPGVPQAMRALISQCLEPDREKRPGSFDLVADELLRLIPELENAGVRVIVPATDQAPSDPDATSALPVVREEDLRDVRESERPRGWANSGPLPSSRMLERAGSPPYGMMAPSSSATPESTVVTASGLTLSAPPFWRRGVFRKHGGSIVLACAASVFVVVLGFAAFVFVRRNDKPGSLASSGSASAQTSLQNAGNSGAPTANSTPSTAASNKPTINESVPAPATSSAIAAIATSGSAPVINVSELPAAKKKTGTMAFTASPNACTIKVDGAPRGVTPIAALSIPAGDHTIECIPVRGKTSSIQIRIREGATSAHTFKTN